jgi:hypothetical protein
VAAAAAGTGDADREASGAAGPRRGGRARGGVGWRRHGQSGPGGGLGAGGGSPAGLAPVRTGQRLLGPRLPENGGLQEAVSAGACHVQVGGDLTRGAADGDGGRQPDLGDGARRRRLEADEDTVAGGQVGDGEQSHVP